MNVSAPLDEPTARELTRLIHNNITAIVHIRDGALDGIREAKDGRADAALGYASWTAYVAAEFGDVLPKLTRDERQPIVAELAALGMSTRAIAPVVGVGDSTVQRDLAAGAPSGAPAVPTSADGTAELPQKPNVVTGLDGKAYKRPTRPDLAAVESAVEEFPELAHFTEIGQPDKAILYAATFRGYDEPELSMRRSNLAKYIAAERRDAGQPPAEPGIDYRALASQIFTACNEATQTISKRGGVDTIIAAIPAADVLTASTWHQEFESLAQACSDLAAACRPQLRSVR